MLQFLAIALAIAGLAFWLARGANTGWSKTSVPIKMLDEVTGIEGIRYRSRFVPGVDFLTVVLASAAVLGTISVLFPRRQKT